MTSPSATVQNVYYERKVGTPKSCYICRRSTSTVLATIKMEDWLYTCDGHLLDPGFATPINAPAPPTSTPTPTPTPEDIRKVVSEYQARETRKKNGDGDTSSTENKDKDKDKDKEKEKEKEKVATTAIPTTSPAPSPAPAPTHKKYALHRTMFDMRRNELRKKEMGVKAKEVSKGLPQVPRTAF